MTVLGASISTRDVIDPVRQDIRYAAPDRRPEERSAWPFQRFAARVTLDLAVVSERWARPDVEGGATAFQHFDWLVGICNHLTVPAGATPLFVEVLDAVTTEVVMLLPLAQVRRFGVTVVTWLNLGVCDYAVPIMAPGVVLSAEQVERAWAAVLEGLPWADLIDLRQIPTDIAGIVNPLALLRHCHPTNLQAFGLPLEGDPKNLLRRLMGGKDYRDLVRREKRLAEHGEVRLVEATTEDDLSTLFGVMLEQRRRRFRALGRFDLLSRPEVEAFYRDAALRSLRNRGPVRLFGLRVGDQWIASAYVLVQANIVHGIILSIAGDEWKKCTPGLIMVSRLMECSLERGCGYFDMTIGNLSYKQVFGGQPRTLHRVLEPRTWLGRCALQAIVASASAMTWVERQPSLSRRLRSLRQGLRRATHWQLQS